MRTLLAMVTAALIGGTLAATPAAAQAVRDESHTAADGTRVLQQSIDVPAGIAEVWAAWTTSAGFREWAAPVAAVDLRLGGSIEASYDPKTPIGAPATIRNEIVAFVPRRMLAIRNVQAPPGTAFDAATFQRLHTVILFDPLADQRTRVTIAQPGYGTDERYDAVYRHFAWGNGWTLERLHERFVRGPVDWTRPAPAAR
jgi:uncharacterized protein YndB with AHSA1/START domain